MVVSIPTFKNSLRGFALALFVGTPVLAGAATFTVNSTRDASDARRGDGVCETATGNGECTLRAALHETNALFGPDRIVLPSGTYLITIPPIISSDSFGRLVIRDDLTIVGAGSTGTIVDGNGLDGVFSSIANSKTINISGITIQNGLVPASGVGGGIRATGFSNINLIDVVIQNNRAGDGGGVYNLGNLTLTDSVVRGNSSANTDPSSTQLRFGGGIFQGGGSLTVRRSSISDNSAMSGAGIFNQGTALVESSTISANVAGNTVLANGDGGGGINTAGAMTITNSTISGNRANGNFAGVFNHDGWLTLNNVTIANNVADADGDGSGSGGGLGNGFGGTATLRNTILAGNQATGTTSDCMSMNAFSVVSAGYNVIGSVGGPGDCTLAATTGDQIGDSGAPINPGVAPLSNNGGPTQTHALTSFSPALDAGDPAGCTDGASMLQTDQRGARRATPSTDPGVRCDVGAFELSRMSVNAGSDQRVAGGVAVALDGSASSADAGIASYVWTQVSGASVTLTNSSSALAGFTAPVGPAVLTFQLTVTDTFGTSGSDMVTVTVNGSPVADAGGDQNVAGGDTVTLDGTASQDADGAIAIYSWLQTAGEPVALSGGSGATPTFVAPATADVLVFQLTVTDNDGATSSDSVTVTVTAPTPPPGSDSNQPPVADAGRDRTKHPRAFVILDGWKSYDVDGKIVSYRWEQTGGPRVRLWRPHWPWAGFVAPREEGELTFQLTVTDDKGAVSTDSVTITVDDCARRWYHSFFKRKHRHRHGHECQ